MMETEVKIAISEEEFAQIYLELEGPKLKREKNWGYFIPDGFVRVRSFGEPAPYHTMTLKKKADGPYNTREEIEMQIGSPEQARKMLERLGLEETLYYEKQRAIKGVGGYDVCLDKIVGLGCFVEVEGNQYDIRDWLIAHGFQDRPIVKKNYFELVKEVRSDGS